MNKSLLQTIAFAFILLFTTSCGDEDLSVVVNETKVDYHRSIEEAQEDLMGILADVDAHNSRSTTRAIINSYERSFGNKSRSGNNLDVYIFNFEDEEGFAMMSTDKRQPSLIALANKGNLNEGDSIENPGLKLFIEYAVTPIDPETPETPIFDPFEPTTPFGKKYEWTNEITHVNGMCSTKWGQNLPYNKYTPVINGFNSPTGCVATSMSQLMAYYEYPQSYNGYTFDWTEIKKTFSPISYSISGADQLARLMQQLGLPSNLNMNYTETGSGASPYNISKTFKAFGYTSGGTLKAYNIEDVVQEVKSNHPLLAGGESKDGGHSWLIHGLLKRTYTVYYGTIRGEYEKDYSKDYYYVLCNWGWDGFADGYYLSDAFNTKSGPTFNENSTSDNLIESTGGKGSYNFNKNITIVSGIRK